MMLVPSAKCLSALIMTLAVLFSDQAFAQTPSPFAECLDARTVADADRRQMNARVFNQVVTTIDQVYPDPAFKGLDWRGLSDAVGPCALNAPDETALYRVMSALTARLNDEHVNVQGPSVWALMARAEAPKVSAGVGFRARDGGVEIVDLRTGTPADRAGVQVGWRLEEIDGEPFSYAPLLDAVPGQRMRWALRDRAGEKQEVLLVLAPPLPPIPPHRIDWPTSGVTRLSFDRFDEGTANWLETQMASLADGDIVILDLRGNTGGLIREFQRIMGCFLPDDTAIIHTASRQGVEPARRTLPGCRKFEGKLAVLVDRYSASVAELAPAILSEAGRAIVVGERTAGAVMNSSTYNLPDGGRLSVSRAELRTAGGQRLEGVGLLPDIIAVTTTQDRRSGRDPALEVAIQAVTP